MTFVYLDTETTGLEDHHQVWELGWAVDDGPIRSAFVSHTTVGASDAALEIGQYHYRRGWDMNLWDEQAECDLLSDLTNATIIAANPTFDAGMLKRRWGVVPWNYRMLDIESWATGILDKTLPPMGMKALYNYLIEYTDLPAPDHSAGGDVNTMREIHRYLRENE